VNDVTNPHDTLEEREARLQTKIQEFRAAEKRRLIKHGMALWTRTEIMQTMAHQAKPKPDDFN
jgi:hypothetical protein